MRHLIDIDLPLFAFAVVFVFVVDIIVIIAAVVALSMGLSVLSATCSVLAFTFSFSFSFHIFVAPCAQINCQKASGNMAKSKLSNGTRRIRNTNKKRHKHASNNSRFVRVSR